MMICSIPLAVSCFQAPTVKLAWGPVPLRFAVHLSIGQLSPTRASHELPPTQRFPILTSACSREQ
eukprot:3577728-Pyramimonas_sp.AAC.1